MFSLRYQIESLHLQRNRRSFKPFSLVIRFSAQFWHLVIAGVSVGMLWVCELWLPLGRPESLGRQLTHFCLEFLKLLLLLLSILFNLLLCFASRVSHPLCTVYRWSDKAHRDHDKLDNVHSLAIIPIRSNAGQKLRN